MSDPAPVEFPCAICNLTFRRAEHLKRHEALHSGVRSFVCGHCSKRFARKDALLRHQSTHDDVPSLLQQGRRACKACARYKVKCSGSMPCNRCKARGITCHFPMQTIQMSNPVNGSGVLQNDNNNVDGQPEPSEGNDANAERSGNNQNQLQTPTSEQHIEEILVAGNGNIHNMYATTSNDMALISAPLVYDERDERTDWRSDLLSSVNWLPVDLSDINLQNYMPDAFTSSYPAVYLNGEGHQSREGPLARRASQDFNVQRSLHAPTTFDTNTVTTDSVATEITEVGDLYVDGQTARRPKTRRRRFTRLVQTAEPSPLATLDLSWPQVNIPSGLEMPRFVSVPMSEKLNEHLLTLCMAESPHPTFFGHAAIPERQHMDVLIDNYFYHVHDVLPFIHKPTFVQRLKENNVHDLNLLLALQVLGSLFLEGPDVERFQASLFKVLQRALTYSTTAAAPVEVADRTKRAQSLLLLATAAGAFPQTLTRSVSIHAINELHLFVLQVTESTAARQDAQTEEGDAVSKTSQEEALRTAWLIWLVSLQRTKSDSQRFQSLQLSCIADLPLPYHENSWNAHNNYDWLSEQKLASRMTMLQYLHCLYVEKRLPSEVDDLTSILMTYAVVHRTWEAQANLRQPLSGLEPSARSKMSSQVSLSKLWPPSDPVFTNWRNSACDCFDILHWRANAACGMAGGYEPTRVLHLHLARSLILSPLEDFLRLTSAASVSSAVSSQGDTIRAIQRWTVLDQYKARLAAIHAGVTQWHVRRFSVNAFYEPFAVACATMTLWAISKFTTRPAEQSSAGDGSNDEARPCDIILIDRPTDDELVQQFVREGHKMRVVLTGVHNLWDSAAPGQILKEGKRLLSTLSAWPGEVRYYNSILDELSGLDLPRS